MNRRAPNVAVVLVTYNRASRLPATLDTVLAQSFGDFELVVSDDCSTDDTRRICREYERRDSRVRYRCNERNLRMPGNLNAALAEVTGEYVAILHDGDLYRGNLLERWVDLLDRHPRAAFAFNAYEIARRPGRNRRTASVDMPECMDGREFLERIFVPSWGSPVFGTAMVRRACLDAVGPFDPRYSMHSDIEMWVRLASRYDVAYAAEPLMTLMPRERDHILRSHYWWEKTVDVRVKRRAVQILHPHSRRARLAFELSARLRYAWGTLPGLRHGRWAEVRQGLYLVATGRDELPPPY